MPTATVNTPRTAQLNIESIARLEHQFLSERTRTERIADTVAAFVGSMGFILLHLVFFAGWLVWNSGIVGETKPFDPFPFVLLTLVVSLEAVLLSAFVLMKQNRMSRRADQRNHLSLQVNLLAEREITKILELQRMMCERLSITAALEDCEVRELSQKTAVEALARDIQDHLPEE